MGFLSSLFGSSRPTEEKNFETLRDDGVRAMQMGELPYAQKCFTAALALQHDLRTVGFLAEALLRTGEYEKALPLLKEISQSANDTLEVDLLLAQTQGRVGLYEEEQLTCAAIIAAHPEEPRALYLAAEADHALHNDIMAIAHLTQCLQLRPAYEQALYLRAKVLAGMLQWAEALADVEALMKVDDEQADYLLLHADILAALGRTDEATADLQKVLTLNPFCDAATLKLGSLYEQTTQWDKALTLYDEAIDMRPEFAAAYKARGGVKNHLKDAEGAAADLKRSLELAPERAKDLDGEYTNVENEMNDRYKRLNPYGF